MDAWNLLHCHDQWLVHQVFPPAEQDRWVMTGDEKIKMTEQFSPDGQMTNSNIFDANRWVRLWIKFHETSTTSLVFLFMNYNNTRKAFTAHNTFWIKNHLWESILHDIPGERVEHSKYLQYPQPKGTPIYQCSVNETGALNILTLCNASSFLCNASCSAWIRNGTPCFW